MMKLNSSLLRADVKQTSPVAYERKPHVAFLKIRIYSLGTFQAANRMVEDNKMINGRKARTLRPFLPL